MGTVNQTCLPSLSYQTAGRIYGFSIFLPNKFTNIPSDVNYKFNLLFETRISVDEPIQKR